MWVAICVGLGVAAMVLLANVPLFRVFRLRSMALPARLPRAPGRAPNVTSASLANPVVTIILSMVIGAIFGYVSEKVAGMLVGSNHHAAAKA